MDLQQDEHPLRHLFALPGCHQQERGAEVALLSVASELVGMGNAVAFTRSVLAA